MSSIKHAVVTLAVGVALLAAAGPASALKESGGRTDAHNPSGEDSRGLWTVTATNPLAADTNVDGLSDDLEVVSEDSADAQLASRFAWRQPNPRREQVFQEVKVEEEAPDA